LQDTLQGNGSGSATAIGLNGGIDQHHARAGCADGDLTMPDFGREPVAVAIAGSAAFAL
jgi:hypothetical protein